MARKFGMGFFGDKFWSSDFLGFCLKPKGFFRVLTFAPIWSSLSLEIRSTASGLELSWKGRWIFHTFHPELIYVLWLETVWRRAMKKPNLLKAVKVLWVLLAPAMKSPFHGVLDIVDIGQFHSLQIARLFHQGQFPYCSGYEWGKASPIFSRFQLGKHFYY